MTSSHGHAPPEFKRRGRSYVGPGSPLTPRQAEALETFRRLYCATGVPPTFREVSAALGLTSVGAVCHFNALIARGLLVRATPGPGGKRVNRGWRPAVPAGACPCCGRLLKTGKGERNGNRPRQEP